MQELTLYQILEVSPDAPEEAIRAAYFRLAKLYHPDLKHRAQSPQGTEKFIEINRAYTVLCDRAKRQLYDLDLRARADETGEARGSETRTEPAPASGAAESPAAEPSGYSRRSHTEAGRAFLKAQQLVDEERFKDAARLLLALLRGDPENAAYLSLAGYALAAAGDRLHQARDFCRRAAEIEPYNAAYLARLAFVYETAGLQKLAERYYAEALRVDPTQPLARACAAGAGGARQKRAAAEGGGGLLAPLRSLLGR